MDNDQLLQEWVTECEVEYTKLAKASPREIGFDPISIFTLILQFLTQACPKPADQLHADVAAGGMAVNLAVQSATRRAFREKYGIFGYRRHNGDAAAAAVLKTAGKKSVEQIQAAQQVCVAL